MKDTFVITTERSSGLNTVFSGHASKAEKKKDSTAIDSAVFRIQN